MSTGVSQPAGTLQGVIIGQDSIAGSGIFTQTAYFNIAVNAAGATSSPVFSPLSSGGPYPTGQQVTITSATSGATIYYTTDGKTVPTTSSTKYTGPITLNSTTTIMAIAVLGSLTNSAVVSAAYSIAAPAATPTFSPAAGSYPSGQAVTISSTTSGATIYYTTSGATPTHSSLVYSSPIPLTSSITLAAIASAAGSSDSSSASAAYTVFPAAAAPTFSPATGSYPSGQTVTIGSATSGAKIYYTLDGSTPTHSSNLYSGAITLTASTTVKAIASAANYSDSAPTTMTYTILGSAAAPTFSPATGSYPSGQTVTISTATSGAQIYYTTDGSKPTHSSKAYSGAIALTSTTTIKAIASASGLTDSSSVAATYTIYPAAAAPTFSPTGGADPSGTTISISTATSGATIYYTTDGSTPTHSSTVYSSPITLSAAFTLNAFASGSTYSDSAVSTAAYTVSAASAPTITTLSPTSGTAGTSVTITGSNFGTAVGTVTFNGTSATVATGNWSATSIVTTVPNGAGTGKVVVTTAGSPGLASAGTTFNYIGTKEYIRLGGRVVAIENQ